MSQTPPSLDEKSSEIDFKEDPLTFTGKPLATDSVESVRLSRFPWRNKKINVDLDAIATQPSVFDDPEQAKFYEPRPDYENIHRFDPSARWTWREEKAVVRKIDWKIMTWVAFMFFSLNIDRGNLSQANTDNFLGDLGLSTNDFNLGNTVFLVSFLCAEVPSQLVSKKLGPDRWIPSQMVLWSIVAGAQFFLTGKKSFLVTRALLGILQGGFIPDNVLYLSYFYNKAELPMRLAIFWVSDSVSGIVASFLAFGILHLRGVDGKEGWRWLFLIEGLLTFTIGLASFFMMPPSPTQTKAWFRPKGYFTEREEVIMVNRILRDDPSKGDMHNRQALTPKMLLRSLMDFDLWPIYAIGLTFQVPTEPPAVYFTLSLKHLGFNTFNINLLTIPVTVLGIFTLIFVSWTSEIFDERAIHGLLGQAWALPFLIIEFLRAGTLSPWSQYAVIGLMLAQPYTHAIQVAWCSRLSNSVRTRTVSAATYNMFVQISNIIASNFYQYRADDAPLYRRGNAVLIGFTIMNCCIFAFSKVYYIMRNRWKARIWDAMTKEEQEHYLATTTDEGNKKLNFRFEH
ncbi:MFS general substrate transporter [Sistotremastrum niveocremeum HHB9708]|uniref:MFS general substrate transporter n=2 Tax=Sistotremastraceae TaxID=3402574 RepID=A0A164N6L6_9AGAM|nr:MFS general substrate transporter [Sistotremastrum niveocremeum HHB9708]KZT37766.1 MFS general substrate transporter [Sistotremastrum suecicum HHB10207 ss-3]